MGESDSQGPPSPEEIKHLSSSHYRLIWDWNLVHRSLGSTKCHSTLCFSKGTFLTLRQIWAFQKNPIALVGWAFHIYDSQRAQTQVTCDLQSAPQDRAKIPFPQAISGRENSLNVYLHANTALGARK